MMKLFCYWQKITHATTLSLHNEKNTLQVVSEVLLVLLSVPQLMLIPTSPPNTVVNIIIDLINNDEIILLVIKDDWCYVRFWPAFFFLAGYI
jgi:hypothetical protein